ncbi:hypothetical protein BDR03DRAFT_941400 [Suillus americanus]|nr:hypothetical protein BDR03DRAFT_941400 [Suillus americanus]
MHAPCTVLTVVDRLDRFMVLHISASRRIYTSLESNRRHAYCPVSPGHDLSVIFSNAEDQTRSQHKHLQHLGN